MMKRFHIEETFIQNDVIIKVIDLDETKKTSALRALRKAIMQTDLVNKDIYAKECYTVIDGVARTNFINLDLADAIIQNLKKEYDVRIKEEKETIF